MKSLDQRIEEAIREEVSIVSYDPEWPLRFKKEAQSIRHLLPAGLIGRIAHFGSTAIPGMAAKPIIDMLIEVTSLEETRRQIVPLLEATGYDYFWRTDVSPSYAWFIKRNSSGIRTHHLHMVEADSKLWERLYFRDYLRAFPEEAKPYEELKRHLFEGFPNDRVAYTEGKTDFVVSVTAKAKRYFNSA